MVGAPEPIDLLVVDVKINVRVSFEAFKVIEFVARTYDTFLYLLLARVLLRYQKDVSVLIPLLTHFLIFLARVIGF